MNCCKNFCLYILLATLFFSCKGIDEIRFNGVDHVEFKGIENNKINFSADVLVSNPSSLSFKVVEVDLKTTIDGMYIGTLTTNDIVKIKSRSDSAYHADFTLTLANIITGASTLYSLSRKKQVTIEMQGIARARSWFTIKKVDVFEKQTVDVPSMSW